MYQTKKNMINENSLHFCSFIDVPWATFDWNYVAPIQFLVAQGNWVFGVVKACMYSNFDIVILYVIVLDLILVHNKMKLIGISLYQSCTMIVTL